MMGTARGHARRGLGITLFGALLVGASSPVASAQDRLTFVGVALDKETRQADKKLRDFLHRKADVDFAPEELEYGRVIDRVVNWGEGDGAYLARLTPYVYVTAEMLGADFEILATYVSAATGRETYNAYFVVRRESFSSRPDLSDVIRLVRERPGPTTFVYHSRFSTSSYFLPTLVFRANDVFNMPESTESLAAVHARQIAENSSTELVRLVASREADLASVWDGTKAKFEPGHTTDALERIGREVHFVRLPVALPNDLLVCSASLSPHVKSRIRDAIRGMTRDEIDTGDFLSWIEMREATEARRALADLRWRSRERAAPVTVEILSGAGGESNAALRDYLEAARQAVRLSGTEFVLFDEDFHDHVDFRWHLDPTHDGAVVLRSTIPGAGVDEQTFQISFRNVDGLVKRIASLMHSRMHRIRYVWPYSGDAPIVIRDTAYSIPAGESARVQRIRWLDPQKNSFRSGPWFDARIREAGFYKYVLDTRAFPESETAEGFDAMSNVAYRVLLVRPTEEPFLFRALTGGLVALLILAAAAAVFDLSRRPLPPPTDTVRPGDSTVMTRTLVDDGQRTPSGAGREWTRSDTPGAEPRH